MSITDNLNIDKLYRIKIIDTAFQYDYLLHAVLAVAAFHLFRTGLKSWNLESASQNQQFESSLNLQVEM
jgi:hypothetical protein